MAKCSTRFVPIQKGANFKPYAMSKRWNGTTENEKYSLSICCWKFNVCSKLHQARHQFYCQNVGWYRNPGFNHCYLQRKSNTCKEPMIICLLIKDLIMLRWLDFRIQSFPNVRIQENSCFLIKRKITRSFLLDRKLHERL